MSQNIQRVHRQLTDAERKVYQERLEQIEIDKPELLRQGRDLRAAHDALVEKVVQELADAKEASGMSLSALEEQTGIDRSRLSRFFTSGSNPTLLTLNRIARALGKEIVVTLK
ncbi:helix-turn-helix domain-containing protein [Planctomicrobium piriforme]|uniref:Helix-turn-helix n=1 Tax=Planctomicrobium piriforme TaxID=1576369 RepID=A0A1I3F8J8_9PLAN|nr:helix-turn-helix transcriptional regulator [Planctomicrobium piriforme]SFI07470.1 Helix-turn-helix [Planctomicrobium piriforme]